MLLVRSVCLSVCLSVRRITEKLWTHFDDISWRGRARPRDQWVQFWWQYWWPSGSRSPKSEIRIYWIIELPTDFDEILRRAGVWPRDQLIIRPTFWWRSASLSGSGSPFRITIQIREELPQFYYAGVRRRSVLSEYFWLLYAFKFKFKFGQLILRKIIKTVATICHMAKLKCTKFNFGSRPPWGSSQRSPDSRTRFDRSYF